MHSILDMISPSWFIAYSWKNSKGQTVSSWKVIRRITARRVILEVVKEVEKNNAGDSLNVITFNKL